MGKEEAEYPGNNQMESFPFMACSLVSGRRETLCSSKVNIAFHLHLDAAGIRSKAVSQPVGKEGGLKEGFSCVDV